MFILKNIIVSWANYTNKQITTFNMRGEMTDAHRVLCCTKLDNRQYGWGKKLIQQSFSKYLLLSYYVSNIIIVEDTQ